MCTYRKQLAILCASLFSFIVSIAQNPIVTENALQGNPSSEWDISGAGSLSIQGFATDISVNKGETVHFKINTNASAYTIDIYRIGYYNGDGARLVGTGVITATLPQSQPDPIEDPVVGLVDCGNWNESAHWDVPDMAVSGVYIAKLTRTNGDASHIIFIVRDDASTSNLFFQASDATWQAYNAYGGNSLYLGSTSLPSGHAAKVSYNRPFVTRSGGGGGGPEEDWFFNAEYPMIRFLERNGYDVTYTTNVDAARRGNLILNHKVFLSVGHDEYWSAEQRTNVEAARDAGVHLAFFSGNEIYWKTRWENSTDVSGTPFRTLVCYKEGLLGESVCGEKCDPTETWTGLWRDGCSFQNGGGCQPENTLSGQISWGSANTSIRVPAAYKDLRFWRHTNITSLAPGTEAIFPVGTLGYEYNWEQYHASYPAGRIKMSQTSLDGRLHKISLYKHASGALVFGAGTVQWSWGLDNVHDRGDEPVDVRMQQATVNLFADMGVQPETLEAGLTAATQTTDVTAPQSIISTPSNGTNIQIGTLTTISGTVSDAGGVIAGVEISTNDGTSWVPLDGTGSWSYSWTPSATGEFVIRVRSFDDSGNLEAAGTAPANNAITITVTDPSVALPPGEGPGGPILVVKSAANPFTSYTAEILRAEGMNEFAVEDISALTPALLNNYDVVVLGEIAVSPAEATLFTDWVNAGGTLIAYRPSAELSSLLGITKVAGTQAEGYILINNFEGSPGAGLVGETIQYHGVADLYTLNDATSVAALYSNATTATPYPAVTTRNVGSNGGKAIAFTYDLARSIVYTRQGNPAWAGQKRDATGGPIRSDDMFFGGNEPDWVDFNKISIPQADEQQRLLVNIIIKSNLHKKPLPRFWFLPSGHKAAIVMTGDDHFNNGTTGQFNHFMTLGPNTPQDVIDWKAIRGTSYIYTGTITDAVAATFQSQGFEIALHVNTGCADFTPASYDNNLASQLYGFMNEYPDVDLPATTRTHCIVWSDWATAAKKQLDYGIRLDANYYYWPAAWVLNRPGMFTGSGMPMRFADLDGSMIDAYQLTTQMSDESEIDYSLFANTLLDKALGPEGYYGVFCANMHTDHSDHVGANAIIASAITRGVPVISAKQMLTWLDGRNNSSFGSIAWNANQLSFTISAFSGANNLRAMLPLYSEDGELASITRNGNVVTYTEQLVKGIRYAFFEAVDGSYVAMYGPATTGTLNGTVTLQARPAAPDAQWVSPAKVDLYTQGNTTTPAHSYNVMIDENGNFAIPHIPAGTYSIALKGSHTLQRVAAGQALIAGNNAVNFGTLIEGDANNDNIADFLDFSMLIYRYNKAFGDPDFNQLTDFNNDGVSDFLDFSLLISNYNLYGETP